jgi:hypothetical protein
MIVLLNNYTQSIFPTEIEEIDNLLYCEYMAKQP